MPAPPHAANGAESRHEIRQVQTSRCRDLLNPALFFEPVLSSDVEKNSVFPISTPHGGWMAAAATAALRRCELRGSLSKHNDWLHTARMVTTVAASCVLCCTESTATWTIGSTPRGWLLLPECTAPCAPDKAGCLVP